jgi:hypothetical protein
MICQRLGLVKAGLAAFHGLRGITGSVEDSFFDELYPEGLPGPGVFGELGYGFQKVEKSFFDPLMLQRSMNVQP